MGLGTFIFLLVVIGIILYVIWRWAPIPQPYKNWIIWIISIIVLIWIFINIFHIDTLLNSIKVGG